MSRECSRSVRDTFLTLRGHSRGTFWTLRSLGPKAPGDTPPDTLSDTPILGDTPSDTPGDTRARRARETPVKGRRCLKPRGGIAPFWGSANLPDKVSSDMGYRRDSIAISRDMGTLSSKGRKGERTNFSTPTPSLGRPPPGGLGPESY